MVTKVEATGRIVIVKVPTGEAPFAIRRAWYGLVLPCQPILGYSDVGERGILSGEKVGENCPALGCCCQGRVGFSVPQDEAIAILKKTNPTAARWWMENGFPKSGEYFSFAEDEAKIISGVERQSHLELTDEMMGDPNR